MSSASSETLFSASTGTSSTRRTVLPLPRMPFKPRRRASGAGKRWSADAVAMSATDLRIIVSRGRRALSPSACQVGLQPASVSAAAGVGRGGRLPAEALGRERLPESAAPESVERRP